jgi:hypothetical protein
MMLWLMNKKHFVEYELAGETEDFSVPQNFQAHSGTHPTSYQMDNEG